jgi:4-amino-4-deoxy-L-arabinose transferase-like glycosyltransferase
MQILEPWLGKGKKSKKRQATAQKSGKNRINYRDILIILGVGLLLRFIYDLHLTGNIFFDNHVLDSLIFHTWANDINNGQAADLVFFRAPLYPYLLALVYKIFGVSQWSIVIVQHIWGLTTCVTGYLFARSLFGRKVALWSGVAMAAFPTLIYFEGEVMITTLATMLYTIAAYRLYLAVKVPTIKAVALAGLAFGLAAIARPTILPLLILFPICFLIKYRIRSWKKAVRWSIILICAALVPIIPVTLTNIAKGGEFVLLSSQGGVNFYIGNGAKADGITVMAPGPNVRFGKYKDNIWTSSMDEAKRRTGKEMSQSAISSFWYSEALTEISEDVPRAMLLYLKKVYFFWHGQEIFNNKSLYYSGEYSWLMLTMMWKFLINFPSGLLFPLAFLGAFFAVRDRREDWSPVLFLVVYGLVVAGFFVCARFRQPIVPVAVILAVFGIYSLANLKRQAPMAILAGLGISAVLLIGLNLGGNVESRENLSQFNTVVGSIYQKNGDHISALPYFEKAYEISPDNGGVVDMLGLSYLGTGNVVEAERVYREGIRRFPAFPPFNAGLARVFQSRIDGADSAYFYFHQALNSAPEYAPAIEGLARLFERRRVLDSALFYYDMLSRYLPPDRRLEQKKQRLRIQITQGKQED